MMLDSRSDNRVALPGPLDAVARTLDRYGTAQALVISHVVYTNSVNLYSALET